jgi:L-rhamnose mutarotase
MQRVAFIINLKPGADTVEYKRRHDEIWPEMLEALREAGARNYSIFLDGSKLFAYLEVEDHHRMREMMAANPVNARWQEHMRDLIENEADPNMRPRPLLAEMFHMD